jgi:poly-D-alanine transfer protein DltD
VPIVQQFFEASGAPTINVDNLSAEEIKYVMKTTDREEKKDKKDSKSSRRLLRQRNKENAVRRSKENAVQRQSRHSVENVYNHARKNMQERGISLQKRLVHRKICEKMRQ